MTWSPTPEQQAQLEQQAFIEELIRLRAGPPPPATSPAVEPAPPKPGWMRFLDSSGGTALITVVLGTLGGALITGLIQSSSQRQQARQLSLAEYVKGEHDVVKQAFDLIGQCVAASENLNILTSEQFDPERYPKGSQRDALLTQKGKLRDEFNKWDDQWRSSRETLTLNMRYYHANEGALSTAWDKTRDSLSAYMDCQHAWYAEHLGHFVPDVEAPKACATERSNLTGALHDLSAALENNRLYAWGNQKP